MRVDRRGQYKPSLTTRLCSLIVIYVPLKSKTCFREKSVLNQPLLHMF